MPSGTLPSPGFTGSHLRAFKYTFPGLNLDLQHHSDVGCAPGICTFKKPSGEGTLLQMSSILHPLTSIPEVRDQSKLFPFSRTSNEITFVQRQWNEVQIPQQFSRSLYSVPNCSSGLPFSYSPQSVTAPFPNISYF